MPKLPQLSCKQFIDDTFSAAPTPGGGSAAALVAGVGTALAGMVCSLTGGKDDYARVQEDIKRIAAGLEQLKSELLELVDRDAENFYPLSRCYRLPETTEEERRSKNEKMQQALRQAAQAPAQMIRCCAEALRLCREAAEIGYRGAVSDAGCSAVCLKAAMDCAWLNVKVNLAAIEDAAYVSGLERELEPLLAEGAALAQRIAETTMRRMER